MTDSDSLLRNRISLSGNALKLIAIIAMTIDHIAWLGIEEYSQAETIQQIFLHSIGRLTAPIMIFFVAEGYLHTRNYWKYLRRMAVLAVISHFAFCYFNGSGFNPLENMMFNATSIVWPLMWGLIFLKVWDTEKFSLFLKILITAAGCAVTFTSDWSCAAPLAILMMGRNPDNIYKQLLWLMAFTAMYAAAFFVFNSQVYGMVHMACWFAVPLICLYNGKRGRLTWLGQFFYAYYPLHMALLGLISRNVPF